MFFVFFAEKRIRDGRTKSRTKASRTSALLREYCAAERLCAVICARSHAHTHAHPYTPGVAFELSIKLRYNSIISFYFIVIIGLFTHILAICNNKFKDKIKNQSEQLKQQVTVVRIYLGPIKLRKSSLVCCDKPLSNSVLLNTEFPLIKINFPHLCVNNEKGINRY